MIKLILLSALLFLSGGSAFSQPGTLDSSYAANGRVLTNYTPAVYLPDASVIQADEKVILMGRYGFPASGVDQIGVSRHKIDESIDTSFGTNGFVSVNVNNHTFGNSIVLQSDGRIVIAGYIQNSSTNISLLVIRFNNNGSLDTTFGNNGIALFNNNMNGLSVKMQSDDKIVVGGRCGNEFAVVRVNTDGNLDTDFGFNGLVTTTIISPSYEAQINAINIQIDGKIVASGFAYVNFTNICFCTVRYDSSGNIDTGFGVSGKAITDLNPSGSELITAQAIQQDGKIVVTGSANNATVVARYQSNGLLDPSFGTNGVVINTFGNSSLSYSLLIQPDNKIVIVGNSPLPTNRYFIARYTDIGILDDTFNSNGYNLLSFGNSNNRFNSVLFQQDGKLLATGFTQIVNDVYTVIARFNSGLLNTDEFEKYKIKIYPNPTKGLVMFDNSNYDFKSVTVFNYLGQQVLKTFDFMQGIVTIGLNSLSNGVYLLQFQGERGIYTTKVVKE